MIDEVERISQGAFGIVYFCNLFRRNTSESIIYKYSSNANANTS